MSLDAEFAKRSEMRIYTHFTMPDGVHGYIGGVSFADSSKAIDKKKSAIFYCRFQQMVITWVFIFLVHITLLPLNGLC